MPTRFYTQSVKVDLDLRPCNPKSSSHHPHLACEVWKWLGKNCSLYYAYKVLYTEHKFDLDLRPHKPKSIGSSSHHEQLTCEVWMCSNKICSLSCPHGKVWRNPLRTYTCIHSLTRPTHEQLHDYNPFQRCCEGLIRVPESSNTIVLFLSNESFQQYIALIHHFHNSSLFSSDTYKSIDISFPWFHWLSSGKQFNKLFKGDMISCWH